MCTAIIMKTTDNKTLFGRNMDIEFDFPAEIVLVQKDFIASRNGFSYKSKYAVLGSAIVAENYPLFAEGFNEKGVACAGLNFPNFCEYEKHSNKDNKDNEGEIVPVYDFTYYVLANFSSVSQFKKASLNMKIVDVDFSEYMKNTTLHWIVGDEFESVVVECEKGVMRVHENPVGVLTNAPSFESQINNLAQFSHLSPKQPMKNNDLPSLGVGGGLVGMSGDFTSLSRFTRASLLKQFSKATGHKEGINQVFHILENVGMVKWAVYTGENKVDWTVYSSCSDLNELTYFYKTYDNFSINGVSMKNEKLDGGEIIKYPMIKNSQFNIQN